MMLRIRILRLLNKIITCFSKRRIRSKDRNLLQKNLKIINIIIMMMILIITTIVV